MPFLPCVELNPQKNLANPSNQADYAIIWLHGLGADGHDFEPIAVELRLALSIRFIFPHAPQIPVSINNGMVMPAWYDIRSPQIDQIEDATGIKRSMDAVIALIEREIERGVKSQHIILAGFSQGGAIALHTGLRYGHPLGGIMGLSTYLPLISSLESELNNANRRTPVLLAHGIEDPIVPLQLAEQTKSILDRLDYRTELHTYPMEHSVCPNEITEIARWIKQCFA